MKTSMALCALVVLAGCASEGARATSGGSQSGVVNFTDTRHGLRLAYPAAWREQNLPKLRGTLLVLSPPHEPGALPTTVSVVVQQSPGSRQDLREVELRTIERAQKQVEDFRLVDTADALVDGQPARRITYTGKKLGMNIQVLNVITLREERGYAISYMADPENFNDHLVEVDWLVDSVRWVR